MLTMKKQLYFLSFFILIIYNACRTYEPVDSVWHNTRFDKESDLLDVLNYKYNTKSKILYMFSNDSSFFYIHLRIPQENEQKMILFHGLDVWINPDNKTKHNFGFKYPVFQRKNMILSGGEPEINDFSKSKVDLILKPAGLRLYGKAEKVNKKETIESNNNDKITGSLVFIDAGILVYTIKVPLLYIISDEYDPERGISVGFEADPVSANRENVTMQGSMMQGTYPYGSQNQQMIYERGNYDIQEPIRFWVKGIKLSNIH